MEDQPPCTICLRSRGFAVPVLISPLVHGRPAPGIPRTCADPAVPPVSLQSSNPRIQAWMRGFATEASTIGIRSLHSTLVNTAPDAWNLKAPVNVGDVQFLWRPMTNTVRLELADPVSGSRESGVGWVGAYALCAVEADADLWAEVTVSSGASGGKFEVQFYLDGKELWDLRLGRETWSPKRLPLRMNHGRHFLLVAARDRRTVPDVFIAIRELGRSSGGRVRPVAPKTHQ